jgi:hypothetical protein
MPSPPHHGTDSEIEEFRELIRIWFARRTGMQFHETFDELLSMRAAVLDELGKGLAPELNSFVQRLALPELADKRLLSRFVNGLSSAFGIKPVCPRSGLPATIVTGQGKGAPHGRFQFSVPAEGKGFVRPTSTVAVPEFSFMPVRIPEALGSTWMDQLRSRMVNSGEHPRGFGR